MNESTSSVILSPDATATVQRAHDHTLVQIAGEVDERAAAACEALVDLVVKGEVPVHVDLRGVTLFSAAGVSWLVRLYAGGTNEVRVVAASAPVREVLRVCGVPMRSRGGLPSPRHAGAY